MTCGKPKRKAKTSHQSGGRRPPPPDPPAAYHTPQTHQPPQQPPAPTQKYNRRIYGFKKAVPAQLVTQESASRACRTRRAHVARRVADPQLLTSIIRAPSARFVLHARNDLP